MPRETSRGTTYYIAKDQYAKAALWGVFVAGAALLLWLIQGDMSGPVAPGAEKGPGLIDTLRTALEGQPWSVRLFAALWGVGILWALLSNTVGSLMRALNVNVTLANEGVVLRDWKRAHKTIPWDVIIGVVWSSTKTAYRWVYRLSVVCSDVADGVAMTEVGYSRAEKELTQLRDDIISRLELSEVPPEQVAALRPRILRFVSSGEDRIWRKSADNTTMDW